jgi:3-dehydroquinate synthase
MDQYYKLQINTKSKNYFITIGYDILHTLPQIINGLSPKITKILIITDTNVAVNYLDEVKSKLTDQFDVLDFIIPSGEQSKSMMMFEKCSSYALSSHLDRNSLIIALGGGVVGDLAGFVAATFMRGIRFIQVPTTLLAHDSAVGGKVAINLPLGKNVVGAFYQPEHVLYHLNFLETLPITEMRSGFAEISKEAMLSSKEEVKWLMDHVKQIADLEQNILKQILKMGVQIKNNIVSTDEKEKGIRAFLNLGHTLGHALEAHLGYSVISHGDGVAFGTLFAIFISEKIYGVDLQFENIRKWYSQLGFPIFTNIDTEEIIQLMKHDKKNIGNRIRFILLKEYGQAELHEIEQEKIHTLLKNFLDLFRNENEM